MIFNYELGLKKEHMENRKVNYRQAVRGIIFKDSKILMVHTNKGDYKFPGGGVNKEEAFEEALMREVCEETGYTVNNVLGKMGVMVERKIDDFDETLMFEMTSHYYLCEVSNTKTAQKLDDYEADLDFQPIWMFIDEAIKINEEILKKDSNDRNPWVDRDTLVLKELRKIRG